MTDFQTIMTQHFGKEPPVKLPRPLTFRKVMLAHKEGTKDYTLYMFQVEGVDKVINVFEWGPVSNTKQYEVHLYNECHSAVLYFNQKLTSKKNRGYSVTHDIKETTSDIALAKFFRNSLVTQLDADSPHSTDAGVLTRIGWLYDGLSEKVEGRLSGSAQRTETFKEKVKAVLAAKKLEDEDFYANNKDHGLF